MDNLNIAIIGLGYVGLPLAVEFSKKYKVVGFDIDNKRINDLRVGFDRTMEVRKENLLGLQNLYYTSAIHDIKKCNVYIVMLRYS